MTKVNRTLLALICLILMSPSLFAQPQGEITLDQIDGVVSGQYIKPGPTSFFLRHNLTGTENITTFRIGFRIYSPNGTHWY